MRHHHAGMPENRGMRPADAMLTLHVARNLVGSRAVVVLLILEFLLDRVTSAPERM
jgi:hypothetical protein